MGTRRQSFKRLTLSGGGCPAGSSARHPVMRSPIRNAWLVAPAFKVASEREIVGRALNAAEEEASRAASEGATGDAQQTAVEATAAVAQASEEHIQAAGTAALQ
jgi:hypothetical protein